ncbi:MAG: hypothetical protein ACI8RD_005030, partial [Bacillariaceae sp.]
NKNYHFGGGGKDDNYNAALVVCLQLITIS